ncbi:MAG: hypothetical protein M3Z27_03415 [Actinomycetota bacterium]|nr:hypothetical protein [Actinomycetota bacterium]
MLHLLVSAAEPSKVPFYFAGGAFAIYAVVLAALGLRSPSFPGGSGGTRAVMGLSFLLMVLAIAMAVVTDK